MRRRGGHHHTASRFLDLDLAQNIDSPAVVRAVGKDVSGIGEQVVVPDERTFLYLNRAGSGIMDPAVMLVDGGVPTTNRKVVEGQPALWQRVEHTVWPGPVHCGQFSASASALEGQLTVPIKARHFMPHMAALVIPMILPMLGGF